ncbi:hypothetical protein [Vibrio fluvialis]|uniref:hypothetical protein n=1 Tax=Vibrio fluvialis TaxID=676 RepID=UPI003D7CD801
MITSSNFSQTRSQRRTNSGVLSFDLSNEAALLSEEFAGLETQVARAVDRALKKTGRWLQTQTKRHLGKTLGIRQAALNRRFILDYDPSTQTVSLWIGLLAIDATQLGAVSQNAAGTRAGRRQFDGAFYRRVYGDTPSVYIRAQRNRVMQHDVVRQNRAPAAYRPVRDPKLVGRFPLQVVGVAIEDETTRFLITLERQANRRFGELLKQELNYAINIE